MGEIVDHLLLRTYLFNMDISSLMSEIVFVWLFRMFATANVECVCVWMCAWVVCFGPWKRTVLNFESGKHRLLPLGRHGWRARGWFEWTKALSLIKRNGSLLALHSSNRRRRGKRSGKRWVEMGLETVSALIEAEAYQFQWEFSWATHYIKWHTHTLIHYSSVFLAGWCAAGCDIKSRRKSNTDRNR